jgi:hypothetical protein
VYDVPSELVDNAANVSLADGGDPAGDPNGSKGSLLPPVSKPLQRGGKLISFKMEKWGFKDEVAKVSCSLTFMYTHVPKNPLL